MKRMLLSTMLLLGAAMPALAHEGAEAKLSPEVQKTVQDARARFRPELEPVFSDMRSARQSLRAEMQKAQPDAATLSQLEDRIAADHQKMMAVRSEMQKELRGTLTPEEYAQLVLSRHEGFGHRHHDHDHEKK
jgi:hypothetical protein